MSAHEDGDDSSFVNIDISGICEAAILPATEDSPVSANSSSDRESLSPTLGGSVVNEAKPEEAPASRTPPAQIRLPFDCPDGLDPVQIDQIAILENAYMRLQQDFDHYRHAAETEKKDHVWQIVTLKDRLIEGTLTEDLEASFTDHVEFQVENGSGFVEAKHQQDVKHLTSQVDSLEHSIALTTLTARETIRTAISKANDARHKEGTSAALAAELVATNKNLQIMVDELQAAALKQRSSAHHLNSDAGALLKNGSADTTTGVSWESSSVTTANPDQSWRSGWLAASKAYSGWLGQRSSERGYSASSKSPCGQHVFNSSVDFENYLKQAKP